MMKSIKLLLFNLLAISAFAQPCIENTPYFESFSGTGGGWFAPTNFFNQGTLNACWSRDTGFTWIKAPSITGGNNSFSGPLGDRTNGGNGYLSADNNPFAFNDFEADLLTPFFSLANDTAPQLSFWYHMYGDEIVNLRLDARVLGTTNWIPLDTILGGSGAFVGQNSPWHRFIYPLDSYVDDTVQFRLITTRQISARSNGANCRTSLDEFSIGEWDGTCRVPLDVRVVAQGIDNAQIEWESLSPQATYEVQYAPGNGVPTNGAKTVVSSRFFNYNSLGPNSSYTVRVRTICAPGDTSAWSSHVTIQTDCGVLSAPWTEDFEGPTWTATTNWTEQGTFDNCFSDSAAALHFWKLCSGPFSTNSGPNADHSPSGPGRYISANHRNTLSVSTFKPVFITPWISLDTLSNPELTFWLHAFSNQTQIGTLTVLIETLQGTTTSILDTSGNLQPSRSAPWKEIILSLNQFASDTIRVKFRYEAVQANQLQELSIDDISIDNAPTCPRPKFPVVLSTSTNGASLDWSSGGASFHQVRYRRANTPTWTVVSTNSSDIILSGLQPNQRYLWEVRDSCSTTNQSVWVSGPAFFTACTVFTAPYSNNFSSNQWQGPSFFSPNGQIGNCFTRFETSSYYWSGARSGFDHVVFSGPNTDHTGGASGYMFTRPETGAADTANIELPMIFLDTLQSPELSFWWHMYGQAIDRLNVYARTPNGPEVLLGSIIGSQTPNASSSWTKQTYSLSSFEGDTVIIRMEGRKGVGNFFTSLSAVIAIDDIVIDEVNSCPTPTQFVASNLTPTTATLSWQGIASNSILEFGPAGFTPGTGQFINPASSPTTLTGLLPNTTYTAYVQDSCTVNLVSSSSLVNFTTLPCPPVTAAGSVALNGSTATGNATGNSTDSIVWFWGDGNASSGPSATHTYAVPGVYTVLQVATNDCGSSDTLATTLTVCGAVVATILTNTNGLTISFDGSSSVGAALSYSWSFGDGTTAQGATPVHTYTSAGTYSVTLVVTDACGTVASTGTTLTVCPNVNLGFAIVPNGNSFTFTASTSGLTNYQWDFGDGTFGAGPVVNHSYTGPGNYTVILTATDDCGTLWSDTNIVTTCPPLVGDFTFNIISSSANGMLVQFLANVSGYTSLIWNWGDGTQSITMATNISHTYPTTSLNYIIQLSLINACGDTLNIVRTLREVGIEEPNGAFANLYPNPVRNELLTVNFKQPLTGNYQVFNSHGKLMLDGTLKDASDLKLNVSLLNPGHYIVRIQGESVWEQKRFIKLE